MARAFVGLGLLAVQQRGKHSVQQAGAVLALGIGLPDLEPLVAVPILDLLFTFFSASNRRTKNRNSLTFFRFSMAFPSFCFSLGVKARGSGSEGSGRESAACSGN
jgi:hypothetical protein